QDRKSKIAKTPGEELWQSWQPTAKSPHPSLLLLLEQDLCFGFQFANDFVGDRGKHIGQIDLDINRVVAHVDTTGHLLAEGATFEVKLISFPALLEREHRSHRTKTAGHLLLHFAKAFVDATPGFDFAKVMGNRHRDGTRHAGPPGKQVGEVSLTLPLYA